MYVLVNIYSGSKKLIEVVLRQEWLFWFYVNFDERFWSIQCHPQTFLDISSCVVWTDTTQHKFKTQPIVNFSFPTESHPEAPADGIPQTCTWYQL